MRNFTLTAFLVLLTLSVRAQDADSTGEKQYPDHHTFAERLTMGLEGGYTRSYLITNISSLAFTQYRPAGGYAAGIALQYQWKKWLAIQTDPGVIQKNYIYERTDAFAGTITHQNNTYIQLPIMAKFIVGDHKLKGFFNVGGYGAYWMAAHIKGSMPNLLDPTLSASATTLSSSVYTYNFNESYQFNSVRDNRVEWGWLAGAGLSYQLTRKIQVYVEGRNTHSLTDQQKKYQTAQIPKYNQSYSLTAGVLFHLTGTAFKK